MICNNKQLRNEVVNFIPKDLKTRFPLGDRNFLYYSRLEIWLETESLNNTTGTQKSSKPLLYYFKFPFSWDITLYTSLITDQGFPRPFMG